MPVEITVPSAEFWPWAPVALPVTNGLRGLYVLGGSLAQSKRNHAPGGVDAKISGSPVVSENSVRTRSLYNFFDTRIADMTEYTAVVVGKAAAAPIDNATAADFVGCLGPNALATGGTGMYSTSTGPGVRTSSYLNNGTTGQFLNSGTVVDATKWALMFSGFGASQTYITDRTNGASDVDDATYPRATTTQSFLIGSSHGGPRSGYADIAFVALYNRRINFAETNAVEAAVRQLMAARDIVV